MNAYAKWRSYYFRRERKWCCSRGENRVNKINFFTPIFNRNFIFIYEKTIYKPILFRGVLNFIDFVSVKYIFFVSKRKNFETKQALNKSIVWRDIVEAEKYELISRDNFSVGLLHTETHLFWRNLKCTYFSECIFEVTKE